MQKIKESIVGFLKTPTKLLELLRQSRSPYSGYTTVSYNFVGKYLLGKHMLLLRKLWHKDNVYTLSIFC